MAASKSKDNKSGKTEENKFEDSEGDMRREGAALMARMEEVFLDLKDTDSNNASHNTLDPHTDDKDGKDYEVDDSLANSHNDNLSLSDYDLDILEVLSGEFDAAHGQKICRATKLLASIME